MVFRAWYLLQCTDHLGILEEDNHLEADTIQVEDKLIPVADKLIPVVDKHLGEGDTVLADIPAEVRMVEAVEGTPD